MLLDSIKNGHSPIIIVTILYAFVGKRLSEHAYWFLSSSCVVFKTAAYVLIETVKQPKVSRHHFPGQSYFLKV